MQLRIGPNRHGPWGMLQSLADGVKLMLKEDVIVKRRGQGRLRPRADRRGHPGLHGDRGDPLRPAGNEVSIFGHRTAMQLTDLPIAMLYILAVASVGIYGIVLAGWSSGSTYPLLGGLRSSRADDLLRDRDGRCVRLGLPLLRARCRPRQIVERAAATAGTSSCCRSSFIIYIVTMVGETNRAPFDMPESEGDLVGGFNTEYSLDQVRAVHARRVRQHGHRLRGGHHPLPRRLAGPVADQHLLGGREPRLVADALVRPQGPAAAVLLHLAARHAAPRPLRPADEARLEGPHPGLAWSG